MRVSLLLLVALVSLTFALAACPSHTATVEDAGPVAGDGGEAASAQASEDAGPFADAGTADSLCLDAGATCAAGERCCDGAHCLPDPDGGHGRSCQHVSCDPLGAACEPEQSACCNGTTCRATSELTWACQRDVPAADGGMGDSGEGGTCLANDSACSSPAVCCSMICTDGHCAPPRACQPQEAGCSEGADCCEGLHCELDGGTGSCRAGGCGTAGQGCTSSSSCCESLRCVTGAGEACDGTSSCSCQGAPN